MTATINTTITALWVPVVVFSHLFAFFWFARMWMLHHPNLFGKRGKKPSSSGSASDGDGVELEIRTEDMVATLAKQPPPSSSKKDAKRKSDQVHGEHAVPQRSTARHPPPTDPCAHLPWLPADAEAGGTPRTDAGSDVSPEHMVVERVHLDWQRLGCSYKIAGGTKVVLHDIWGAANPGEMQVRGTSS
jgi:hypothetical protein